MNDFLIIIKDDEELTNLKHELTTHFEMKDEHEFNDIKIHQMNYIHILFHWYRMQDCNFMNISMNSSIKLIAIMNLNAKIDFS